MVHLPNNEWIKQMAEKLNELNPRDDRLVELQEQRKD